MRRPLAILLSTVLHRVLIDLGTVLFLCHSHRTVAQLTCLPRNLPYAVNVGKYF